MAHCVAFSEIRYDNSLKQDFGQSFHLSYCLCLFFSKSQSLTNAFNAFGETFRSSNEDEAKAETIRNLRKSFASLFSD